VTVAALVFKDVHLEATGWLVEMVKEMIDGYSLATYEQFQDELDDFASTARECAKAATTVVTLYEAIGADLRMLGDHAVKVGDTLDQEARQKATEAMQTRQVRSKNSHESSATVDACDMLWKLRGKIQHYLINTGKLRHLDIFEVIPYCCFAHRRVFCTRSFGQPQVQQLIAIILCDHAFSCLRDATAQNHHTLILVHLAFPWFLEEYKSLGKARG
jgi:hypothetical protein